MWLNDQFTSRGYSPENVLVLLEIKNWFVGANGHTEFGIAGVKTVIISMRIDDIA